jgi:hypothetical protein
MLRKTMSAAGPQQVCRERARRWSGRGGAALAALTLAFAALPASVAAVPADAVATETYLATAYRYQQAVAANVHASLAAAQSSETSIASECPDVLRGVPTSVSSTSSTAPAFAELARELSQAGELTTETDAAVAAATAQPDRQALEAFVAAASDLQWSSTQLSEAIRAGIVRRQEAFDTSPPNVCADMQAWASSGHRTLSSGTQEFLAGQAARRAKPSAKAEDQAIERLLEPYEADSNKALARRISALASKTEKQLVTGVEGIVLRLRTALGLQPLLGEVSTGMAIARGRTAAGEGFVAKLQTAVDAEPGSCKARVSIDSADTGGRSKGLGGLLFSGLCLSDRYSGAQAGVNCNSGVLTIHAYMPMSARNVTLLLSDGRRVTSRVIFVPARLGGRIGLYYQAVRGPSPIPVSLTELDAGGRALRVVRLSAVVECTRHPLKYLPGGRLTLVHAQAPNGPRFSIVAEHYRFLGHAYFEFKVHVAQEPSEGLRGGAGFGGSIFLGPGERPAFSPEEAFGCMPRFYDIIYGLLRPPGASVSVRIAGSLTQLHNVAVPAYLHSGGLLAYGAFSSPPAELVVDDAHGYVLTKQSLMGSARLPVEGCESGGEGATSAPTAPGTIGAMPQRSP